MPNLPGGCTNEKQFSNYVYERVRECILRYMSKEATARHLRDRYLIAYGCTELAWCNLERFNPEFFRTYFENGSPNATALAKMAKQAALAQIKEETGSCKTPNSPPNGDSDKASSLFDTMAREEEEELMEFARNFLSQMAEEEAAYPHNGSNPIVSVEQSSSKAGQSQALEKQTLHASQQQQQQPVYPTAEFWEKLMSTLGRIQSNTEQMVKLMTDGHGFAPHPSAAGSFKRKRERTEAEKLQDQNQPRQTHGQSRGTKAAKKH